jgi:pilus assembly protein Flp/PilA
MLALQMLSSALQNTVPAPSSLTNARKYLEGCTEEDWISRRIWAPLMLTKEWAMRRLTKLLRCEKGANAIEYALVASLIAIAAVGAFQSLGNKIDTMYNNVSNHL